MDYLHIMYHVYILYVYSLCEKKMQGAIIHEDKEAGWLPSNSSVPGGLWSYHDPQRQTAEGAGRGTPDFNTGSHPVMVATSVAARRLNIVSVTHVINYDMCQTILTSTSTISEEKMASGDQTWATMPSLTYRTSNTFYSPDGTKF